MVLKASAVPSNITRQEQLIAWAIMALDESTPSQTVLERPNLVSFNTEYQIIKSPSGQQLFVGRVVLPMDELSALPAGAKPWIAMLDIPQAATINAYYTAN